MSVVNDLAVTWYAEARKLEQQAAATTGERDVHTRTYLEGRALERRTCADELTRAMLVGPLQSSTMLTIYRPVALPTPKETV